MKSRKCSLFIILALLVFSMQACGNRSNEMYGEMSMSIVEDENPAMEARERLYAPASESTSNYTALAKQKEQAVNFMTSKAADGTYDGDKKFIRTANLRFQVADVVSATHAIEDIIIAKKGFIINSTLTNQELYTTETRISKDSIQIRTNNRLNGTMKLRVHHTFLDAALREIAPLAECIEYRTVDADDATFRILANKLEQDRKKDKSARIKNVSASSKSYKLDDLLAAEESIDAARGEADEAIVAEKEMYDQIEYSTITISLWQEPTVYTKTRLRVAEPTAYKQGFFKNIADSFASGWEGVLETIEVLVILWPWLLIIGGVLFAIIRFRKKKKREQAEL